MVICLERGADLHMAQLMPLPSLSLASVKSRLVLLLWYRLTRVVPDKGPLNVFVCVCYPAENVVLPTFAAAAPCWCSCAAIDPYLILPGPTASNLPHSTAVSEWERRMDRRTRYRFVGSALHAMQAERRGLIGALRICFQCAEMLVTSLIACIAIVSNCVFVLYF